MESNRCPDVSFDEILQCTICMELIADPRGLPCLHNYCLKCIANWCSAKKPGYSAACPLCKQEFTIPNDGIDTLPKNVFIGNLLNLNKLKSAEARVELCEICVDVDEDVKQAADKFAQFFCLECQQRMCKLCSTFHSKMKNSSSHKLISLDEISSSRGVYSKYVSAKCDKHADKKVDVFCFVCKTTFCTMCYIKDHSLHKCSDVAKVAGDFRTSLNQDIHHLTMALKTYDGNLTHIQRDGVKFLEKAKQVETEICKRSDQLQAEIVTAKRKLIDNLNATVANHQKEIANVTGEITQNKSFLQRSLNYCRELLLKGSDADIAREASSLHTKAEELGKVKSVAAFLKDVSVLDISFSTSHLTYSHPGSVLGVVAKKGVEPTLLATTTVNDVTAIALLDGELYVSEANVRDVSVYDSDSLQMKHQIPFAELASSPTGLATCSTIKCLYVSDFFNQRVFRYDLSNTNGSRALMYWRVSRNPGQLAVKGTDRNVLVAFEGGGGLEEYTSTGTIVRSLFRNSTIFQAIELNVNTLLLNQWQPVHSIFTTSKDGSLGQEFTDMPGEKCSLAADSYGNIVFCDKRNNRLQVVNSSLTSVHTLPLPDGVDLRSPNALCYDEIERRLYVGEGKWPTFGSPSDQSDESTGFRLLVIDVNNFN